MVWPRVTSGLGAAAELRARLYDVGWRAVHRAPGPIVSVGNIALGGQGKTPLVALLARWFSDAGARPAVVSRGYGRRGRRPILVSDGSGPRCSADEGGDEPVMLARGTDAIVVVDADRVRGARRAFAEHGAEVVILDDGFQHRRLHRDLDVVVLGEPPPPMFPLGRGREPSSALARADLVVAIRPGVGPEHLGPVASRPPALHAPVWGLIEAVAHVDARGDDPRPPEELRGRRVALLTGVARPERVVRTLEALGARVVLHAARPDHGRLSTARRSAFSRRAAEAGAEVEVTTEKDAARWGEVAAGMRALRVELRLEVEGAGRLAAEVSRRTGVSLRPAGPASPAPPRAST